MAAHEHLIDLMPDFGWALHHHNECVGALDACPVTIAVRKADTFPDHMPGTYACHVNAVGEVELRTVAPRLTEREIEARHDKQAARVAELERQRDAVLALCERKECDPCGTCAYAGVSVDDIRKIYGGGQ